MIRPFMPALLSAPCPVIMEIKRHDGHGIDLLGGRSVAQLVADYEQAGAGCLSVVTGRWFGGSQALLSEVRALTALPILQKDFLTSPRHLARAVEDGADAVLLTATVLGTSCLADLVDAALQLGLTPFVEVANETEILAVPHADHCVIAVNNKDIRHRERGFGDVERSVALLAAVLETGTPCPVSASGVGGPVEAAALVAYGYAGVLVGASLLRSASIAGWVDAYHHAAGNEELAQAEAS